MIRTLSDGRLLISTVRYLGSDTKKYRSQITLDGFVVSMWDYPHYAISKRKAYRSAYRAGCNIVKFYRG